MAGDFKGYIYLFHNKITNKYYIGQTTRNVNVRVAEHLKSSTKNSKNHFHRSLYKYGIDNFDIQILHSITTDNKKDLIKLLNMLEQQEIINYNSFENGYNSNSGGKNYILTDDLKKKLSDSHKGIIFTEEHKKHLSEANKNNINLINSLKGRKVSEITKNKISSSVKNTYTDEHKMAVSKASKGKNRSDDFKKKVSETLKGHRHSEETKKKLSEISKKVNSNPEYKKKLSESVRLSWIKRKQMKLEKSSEE